MWDLRSTKGSGPVSILMMTVMILRKLLDSRLKVTRLKSNSSLSCSSLKWGWKHFWRAERKATYGACPLHMPWDVGKPPQPPLQPDPWTHPYPHQLPSSSESEWESKGTCFLFSLLLQQEPNKALPGFPVWPLISFYWLRRSTTLIGKHLPRCHTRGDSLLHRWCKQLEKNFEKKSDMIGFVSKNSGSVRNKLMD